MYSCSLPVGNLLLNNMPAKRENGSAGRIIPILILFPACFSEEKGYNTAMEVGGTLHIFGVPRRRRQQFRFFQRA